MTDKKNKQPIDMSGSIFGKPHGWDTREPSERLTGDLLEDLRGHKIEDDIDERHGVPDTREISENIYDGAEERVGQNELDEDEVRENLAEKERESLEKEQMKKNLENLGR